MANAGQDAPPTMCVEFVKVLGCDVNWTPIGIKLSVFGRVMRFSLGKCLTQLSTCHPSGALEFGVSTFLHTWRPAGAKRFTQSRNRSIEIALLA